MGSKHGTHEFAGNACENRLKSHPSTNPPGKRSTRKRCPSPPHAAQISDPSGEFRKFCAPGVHLEPDLHVHQTSETSSDLPNYGWPSGDNVGTDAKTDTSSCNLTGMAGRVLHVDGYEGKVVAIDMVTDEVVAAADTPELLVAIIRVEAIENAMILRVPELDSPLRVGLG